MNKRGAWQGYLIASSIIFAVVLFFVWIFGGLTPSDIVGELGTESLKERIEADVSFNDFAITESSTTRWPAFFDYIFGTIPQYLVDLTSSGARGGQATSAVIILVGIWFLLFLTFSDIVRLFGTFSTYTAWLIAFVLAVIAANVKLISFISVFMLTITAGLGAISVFASLVIMFVLFLGVQLGSQKLRKFAEDRKISEMKMRAAAGNAQALEGLKSLRSLGVKLSE